MVEDWLVYLLYAGVLGVIIGWALARARAPRQQEPVRTEQEREENPKEPEREHLTLDSVLGLDRALAAKFYRQLRKSLAQGEIRIALVSDACPNGYVAYDFVREDWICVEKDGSSYPLGGRPAGEHLEVEDGLKGVAVDGG